MKRTLLVLATVAILATGGVADTKDFDTIRRENEAYGLHWGDPCGWTLDQCIEHFGMSAHLLGTAHQSVGRMDWGVCDVYRFYDAGGGYIEVAILRHDVVVAGTKNVHATFEGASVWCATGQLKAGTVCYYCKIP